jgi:tetratricopeptide (TPR) repeat protein
MRLPEAEEDHQEALQANPYQASVWCGPQEFWLPQDTLPEAVTCETTLTLDSARPDDHLRLANVYKQRGGRAEAITRYRRTLELVPDQREALLSLGVLLAEQGQVEEAISHWQRLLHLRPDHAQAHHNLGVAQAQQGKLERAAESLRRALELKPDYADACFNLGNVLVQQRKRADAVAVYERALELRPDYPDAYNNLGLNLTELRRPGEAAVLLRQAVRLRPTSAEAHNNLGLALADLGRFSEAETCYHEALRLNARYTEAHVNLASAYKEQGRLPEALASYRVALWTDPHSVGAHWNRSLAWLAAGDFEHGWPEYEWRWRRKETPARPLPRPRWDGSPLGGRTILIYMEQGLGDMIQFIRYTELVKDRGGTLVVECPSFLLPLFSRCRGIDRLVAEGTPLPDFDIQAPLLSLPGLLGTTLATIPARVPYLSPDPGLVERWRDKLRGIDGFKIGITWQGNPHHRWDHYRSFPLREFAPLARLPGVRLISLQKGTGTEQLHAPDLGFQITELDSEQDASRVSFMDSAAIMKNLDLVIAVDSSLAHLAGALAVPVWVPLPAVPDWRWMFGREDSPWYPTMRLFRQRKLGSWKPVFQRMARELKEAQLSHCPALQKAPLRNEA